MRFISRFYNSRVQAVSGKNEQTAQTAWRGAPMLEQIIFCKIIG